jgi:hypothetical protein
MKKLRENTANTKSGRTVSVRGSTFGRTLGISKTDSIHCSVRLGSTLTENKDNFGHIL